LSRLVDAQVLNFNVIRKVEGEVPMTWRRWFSRDGVGTSNARPQHASLGREQNATRRALRWRPVVERLEDYLLLTTYTVINTQNSGGSGTSGSFRYCWNQVAQGTGPGEIDFAIPTSDPGYNAAKNTWTIQLVPTSNDPNGKLLTQANTVAIKGWTQGNVIGQPNYTGKPLIVLDGSQTPQINMLDLGGSGNSVAGAPNSLIQGLSVVNCAYQAPNGGNAIIVEPTSPGVTIQGCYLGVLPDGTPAGNGVAGIAADAANLTIGGPDPVDRNVISGNAQAGIAIATLPSTIDVSGVPVTVGGVTASGDVIENNFIGTDPTGEFSSPGQANGYGVALGGTMGAQVISNVISGNTHDGIVITSNSFGTVITSYQTIDGFSVTLPDQQASNTVIQQNSIGIDPSLTGANANGGAGIDLLGTTADGNTQTVDHTVIGGDVNARNIIGGNTGPGILLDGSLTTATTISNNDIGGPPGQAIPNGGAGISIIGGSNNNIIGIGPTDNDALPSTGGNFIAYNTGAGVSVGSNATDTAAVANTIEGNEISYNGGVPIDLGADGATPNQTGTTVTPGPNDFQDYPTLTSVSTTGLFPTITGSFDEPAEPNTTLRIEFFADRNNPPNDTAGQVYLGSTEITTDGNGQVPTFTAGGFGPPPGYNVSATATVISTTASGINVGDTSEFSPDLTPDQTSISNFTLSPGSPATAGQSITATVTVVDTKHTGIVPTGTVNIDSGTTQVGSGTLSNGSVTILLSLPAGNYSLTAVYVSDNSSSFQGTTSTPQSYTVNASAADPTSISNFTLSPGSPATAGQAITATVTVVDTKHTGTVPTGTVNIDSGATQVGSGTLSNGSVTIPLSLATGNYSLTAVYVSNDNSVQGTTSTSQSYTVNASAADATSISSFVLSPPTPTTTGQAITASVTVVDTTHSGTIPIGTVTILNNGAVPIASGQLINGSVTIPLSLAAGNYSLTALYFSAFINSSFQDTTSTPQSYTVNAASAGDPTSISSFVLSPTSPAAFGQSITATVTVVDTTNTGTVPTGTVNIDSGATQVGSGTLSNGSVTIPLDLTLGDYSLTAIYDGGSSFQSATAGPQSYTVNASSVDATSISSFVLSPPTPTTTGQTITASVTVVDTTNSAVIPSGTVTILNNGSMPIASGQLTDGSVTIPLSLAAGNYSLTALYVYYIDNSFQRTMSTPQSYTVNAASAGDPTSISSFVLSPTSPAAFGQSITATVTVVDTKHTGTVPTGTVNIDSGATQVGSGTLSNGSVTIPLSLAAGNYSLTAVYVSDNSSSLQDTASTPQSYTVNAPPADATSISSLALSPTSPAAFGQSITATVTVVDTTNTGTVPTGTVDLSSGTTQVGSGTLSNGSVTIPLSLAAGSYFLTALYVSDNSSSFQDTTSTPQSYTVNASAAEATSISSFVLSPPTPTTAGQAITASVTVVDTTHSATIPSGTVTILNNGSVPIASGQLTNGSVTIPLDLTQGDYSLTALYDGGSSFQSATAGPQSYTVGGSPTADRTSISTFGVSPTSPATAGQAITATVTVVDTTHTGTVPTGTVDLSSGATQVGSGTLSNGSVTIPLSLAAGNYSLTAVYVSDNSSSFQGTTSTPQSYTVNAPPADATSISTFGVSPTSPTAGQPITFTATVSDSTNPSAIPTGEVDVIDRNTGTKIGSGNLDSGGNVTITVMLPAGSYKPYFAYLGTSNNHAANTLNLPTLTVTPTPTPTPTRTPMPPQPAGTPSLQQSRKGTSVNLSFNTPLDPSSAGNVALYSAFGAVKKKGKTVFTKRIPIKNVTVSGTALSVLINLAKKYKGSLQLEILPGLKSANGATTSQSTMIEVP
jgi:hypothetical protein